MEWYLLPRYAQRVSMGLPDEPVTDHSATARALGRGLVESDGPRPPYLGRKPPMLVAPRVLAIRPRCPSPKGCTIDSGCQAMLSCIKGQHY